MKERRALYDYTIPASQRTNLRKNALWLEVSNLLGGTISKFISISIFLCLIFCEYTYRYVIRFISYKSIIHYICLLGALGPEEAKARISG